MSNYFVREFEFERNLPYLIRPCSDLIKEYLMQGVAVQA